MKNDWPSIQGACVLILNMHKYTQSTMGCEGPIKFRHALHAWLGGGFGSVGLAARLRRCHVPKKGFIGFSTIFAPQPTPKKSGTADLISHP